MGLRRVVLDSDDDLDGFPSLRRTSTISSRLTKSATEQPQSPTRTPIPSNLDVGAQAAALTTTVRRRKLGSLNHDTSLLRPPRDSKHSSQRGGLDHHRVEAIDLPQNSSPNTSRPRARIELRTRRTKRVSKLPEDGLGEFSTEEASVLEDVAFDDAFYESSKTKSQLDGANAKSKNCLSDKHIPRQATTNDTNRQDRCETKDGDQSEVEKVANGQGAANAPADDRHDAGGDGGSDSDSDIDVDSDSDESEFQDSSVCSFSSKDSLNDFFSRSPTKRLAVTKRQMPKTQRKTASKTPHLQTTTDAYTDEGSSLFFSAEESFSNNHPKFPSGVALKKPSANKTPLAGLETPPPEKPQTVHPGPLQSPLKKLPRIPQTPHQPNTDDFWNQEIVDDWNMEHSPRKLLFDPDVTRRKGTLRGEPNGAAPTAAPRSSPKKKPTAASWVKETKKLFQRNKHAMAEDFLAELDNTITDGQLSRLAATTGGVRIEWTNKLNTTAGRANWRRETLRPKKAALVINIEDGSVESTGTVETTARVKHHASIELAEKVIDDEHRLLNVIAHEFCHLANFMVSGITGNPHGKEFKAWAAKCSQHFGDRGIQVTTKHAYEIDFKYVWTCEACATEFKRHSKSIDPVRHRCGACKGTLKQTKPIPRSAGTKGVSKQGGSNTNTAATGPTEYQKFMKEHMAIVRRENPNSPQKVIMTIVADRWTKAKALKSASRDQPVSRMPEYSGTGNRGGIDTNMDHLGKALVDLTLG